MIGFRILFKSTAGFTLIELLVVIAVIGILATIAVPRLTGVTDRAYLTEAQQTLGSLRQAMEMYYVENGDYNVTDVTGGPTDLNSSGPDSGAHELLDFIDSNSLPARWNYKIEGGDGTFTITMDGDDADDGISDDIGATIDENGDVDTCVNGDYNAD